MAVDETAWLGLGGKGTALPCPCSVNAPENRLHSLY